MNISFFLVTNKIILKRDDKKMPSRKDWTYMKHISNWKLICRNKKLRIYLNDIKIYDRDFFTNEFAKSVYGDLDRVSKIKIELEMSSKNNFEIIKELRID